MNTTSPSQYAVMGLMVLLGSVKVKESCHWCGIGLIVVAGIIFITAIRKNYIQKKWRKRN
ncbi:MAG: hypothetical protein COB98_00490 [Flavobacteriaceae bacterium]|nr:MAG: hypothetical protein COB98_00490 [Flavobacteriaceae bacterium]